MSIPRTPRPGPKKAGNAADADEHKDDEVSEDEHDRQIPGRRRYETEIQGNKFRNVRLPTFWRNRPKLWFAQLESEFVAYRIRSDDIRYSAVVRHLDEVTMLAVANILECPPDTGRFEALKNTLITRFSDSLEKQLRTLMSEMELGDKTPSTLLREMRALAGTPVTDDLLKTLWMQRLPQRIQELLTGRRKPE